VTSSDRKQATIVSHEIHEHGGQERVTARLVRLLLDDGWSVTTVARRCELPDHPGLRKLSVPGPSRPTALAFPWFFLAGSLLVLRHRRGLLHVNGSVVPNAADVATVHFCHAAFEEVRAAEGFRRSQRRNAAYLLNELVAGILYRASERIAYRPSRRRRLVAVSEGLAKELAAHFPRMAGLIETIPNAVDPVEFRPDAELRSRVRSELGLSPDELVCLFVGGDWERKGLRIAIESLVDATEWRLLVVGGGDEERYRSLADDLGVGSRVTFAGPQQETAGFYAAADAFVLPTAYEANCLVAFEAAASGVPVVLSPVSGLPQDVSSGVDGYVVERDPAAVAATLLELRSGEIRKRLGERGRQLVAATTWQRVEAAYTDLYRRLGVAA
jgi:glycosyltransferase involved in cell wall biosynthesis